MAINWVNRFRPTSFDEMALYPLLRRRLEFYAKSGEFPHLLMVGDTGVGKTTAARILCGGDEIEYDCTKKNAKSDMVRIANQTHIRTLLGTKRLIIMDEFHEVRKDAQVLFNKIMEDGADRNTFIFCVNDIHAVAPPIVSRCTPMHFDVGILHPKTLKLVIHNYASITESQWIKELTRVGEIVAKKGGYSPTKKQLDIVASNPVHTIDARSYIMELEQQIKMDESDSLP